MDSDKLYKNLKKVVPASIKKKVNNTLFLSNIKMKKKKSNNNIFLCGTPIHGNLGDQAIALAEYKFFSEYLPEYNIIEIISPYISENIGMLKKIIGENIICIHGGGFLGTLWEEEEKISRVLIKNFPNNKIIIFPQTIYYEETEKGMLMLKESKDLYKNAKDLHICAREETSYEFMKKEYPSTDILLVPDIVTCLNAYDSNSTRDGILLCIRNDKESVQNDTFGEELKNMAFKYSKNVRFTDTVIEAIVYPDDRNMCVNKKLDEFATAKLVITDRLHGMIFSAISGTPCIAINNKSGKVKGVYKWLQNLKYIKFVENQKEIEKYVDTLIIMNNCKFNNKELIPNYENISNLFKKI